MSFRDKIVDGNSNHVAHVWQKVSVSLKHFQICNRCRSNQMLHACTPIPNLPSNRNTMCNTERKKYSDTKYKFDKDKIERMLPPESKWDIMYFCLFKSFLKLYLSYCRCSSVLKWQCYTNQLLIQNSTLLGQESSL